MIFSKSRIISLIALSSLFMQSGLAAKTCLLSKSDADIEIDFWGFWKPEAFAGKNFTFLNNNNFQDQIFYFRHTNDWFFDLVYGKETFGRPVVEFKTSMRNRAVWGSPSTIANTLHSPIKGGGVEFGEHNHAFPRLFFWMREAWLQVSLPEFLHLGLENNHTFTVGAFPFELGRGISLGSAYALGPGPLGFYSDAMVDQYAFGLKFSGEIVPQVLTYDVYGSILQSRSSSLGETNKPIYKNEIGRRDNPARGFGKDNYIIAARLNWTAMDDRRWGKVIFEPYGLYNNDPEQRIEFDGDASSKLGTFGFAGEYIGSRLEFGFDIAKNVGSQFVKPWDRNRIVLENYNGQIVAVNNNVIMVSDNAFNGLKTPDVPKNPSQKIIGQSSDLGSASQNGQLIPGGQDLASVGYAQGPLSLKNSDRRFRTGPEGNGYYNKYKGWMAVADAGYWVYRKVLQVAITGGYASGDQDPNFDVIDGDFKGFIGLQEAYAGKRVKSVFLLGTVGKAKRPGTAPENPLANKDFAASCSGFTNLGFIGSGLTWKPADCVTRFVLNPNVFAYWEPSPGKKFNAQTGMNSPEDASKFLGIELNTFLSYYPFASLKCFAIGSVFFPGQHFKDIKGKPLDDAQKRALDKFKINFDPKSLPNVGDDIAYTINIGMEFAF
jgi:hypothetical protein